MTEHSEATTAAAWSAVHVIDEKVGLHDADVEPLQAAIADAIAQYVEGGTKAWAVVCAINGKIVSVHNSRVSADSRSSGYVGYRVVPCTVRLETNETQGDSDD